MIKEKTNNIWRFAFFTCLVCSLLLSLSYGLLKRRQEMNVELDQKKHILKVVGLGDYLKTQHTAEEMLVRYDNLIQEMMVDVHGLSMAQQQEGAHRVYVYHEASQIKSYCFPIKGKGLWSTIEGFIALDADAETIRGITFSSHGETPGLGGEIESEAFTRNFAGKKIYDIDQNDFVALDILKGKALESIEAKKRAFAVDGITGATMTSNAVEELLKNWLEVYQPFLERIKGR
ncbi:NADH:ubiquinone reductase (Na(+)-transporting) subunit C [Candidatus Omnitrophota bacterium]